MGKIEKEHHEKSNVNIFTLLGISVIISFIFAFVMFFFERLTIAPYLALFKQDWMTDYEAVIIFMILIILFIWIILMLLSLLFVKSKSKESKEKRVSKEKGKKMK